MASGPFMRAACYAVRRAGDQVLIAKIGPIGALHTRTSSSQRRNFEVNGSAWLASLVFATSGKGQGGQARQNMKDLIWLFFDASRWASGLKTRLALASTMMTKANVL